MIAAGLIIFIVACVLSYIMANGMAKDLKNNINRLSNIAKTVRDTADQISEASENLVDGSSKQAAAIEETSATMNETEAMVAQNAENTRAAARIAEQSSHEAAETGKYMSELMETMSELKESSNKVNKIIKTIDDIAVQTNMLAMNATVEAARAGGDAGRSFGVVAEEVRQLALKSAKSSKETAEIIENNIKLTDTSRERAEQVLALAKQNAEHTGKLGELISEIHAASEEQANGIKQINIAVSQIEQSMQANVIIAEKNSAAASDLHDEVIMLDQAIDEEAKLI
jgi:methyl-accepting chemotaxis protein